MKSTNVWFTITGTNYRHGKDFLEPGMTVRLKKEPDNKYDNEAIRVEIDGLGHIGYVANSVNTRIGESRSAGRIYDLFGDTAYGTVRFNVNEGVVCLLTECDPTKAPDTGIFEDEATTRIPF